MLADPLLDASLLLPVVGDEELIDRDELALAIFIALSATTKSTSLACSDKTPLLWLSLLALHIATHGGICHCGHIGALVADQVAFSISSIDLGIASYCLDHMIIQTS